MDHKPPKPPSLYSENVWTARKNGVEDMVKAKAHARSRSMMTAWYDFQFSFFRSLARIIITPTSHLPLALPIRFQPLSPTWSIKSLLPPSPPPSVITIQDLQHLLRLAQLRPPHTEYETSALVRDVNDIAHFVRHIREVDVEDVRPLRGVWRDEVGMALRNDVAEEGEASGRVLLGKAKKISGQYYAVEGGEKGLASGD
ncbi:hypothetical protein BC938DRAFT_483921 [Jimgerdemannia flammicorona]|uniref:Glutamyl-tRNA amidotransferase complex subunit Gta3 domain-containing protein n=1 Tax=Jimgerdemannia flammicorona TaxID=994334 RepID=A0A433QAU8_9FUNG|nr:hypothetical protein BC938DRAFT_483921 [Jimgerdemannia flammicorona]